MQKALLPFAGGMALGALAIALLARFAFGPPILLSIPIIVAIIVLYQSGLLLLELWLGAQPAIVWGWLCGALGMVVGLAALWPQPPRNPAVLPVWLATDMALRSLKPRARAWLSARLGRPSNRD